MPTGTRKRVVPARRSVGNFPGVASGAQRVMIAEWCKSLSVSLTGKLPPVPSRGPAGGPHPDLPPRLRQTLDRLLAGDSEKQIAAKLSISPHTVHTYVKTLHKRFGVASRGELLARFLSV